MPLQFLPRFCYSSDLAHVAQLMDPPFNSFDYTSAYFVGSQFSEENIEESSENRTKRRATAPFRPPQLGAVCVNDDGHYWLGRAHGYATSDPSLGFTPHDNTMAARNAWHLAHSLESNLASAPIQNEYIPDNLRNPYSTYVPDVYQNTGGAQVASSSTAASQGSSQSVKMEIPAGPAPPNRRRPRYFCDMDACKERRKSFSRPADLTRHQDAVHGHSSVRYLCSTRPCAYHCLRRDKMKEHCQKMHDQRRGQEQFSSELYDGALEENPQWRWWLTHSI